LRYYVNEREREGERGREMERVRDVIPSHTTLYFTPFFAENAIDRTF
jgi:hypothetical protein